MRMLRDDHRVSPIQEYAATASLHTFLETSMMSLNIKDGHLVALTITLETTGGRKYLFRFIVSKAEVGGPRLQE